VGRDVRWRGEEVADGEVDRDESPIDAGGDAALTDGRRPRDEEEDEAEAEE
jgi:hypothetical protein